MQDLITVGTLTSHNRLAFLRTYLYKKLLPRSICLILKIIYAILLFCTCIGAKDVVTLPREIHAGFLIGKRNNFCA